MSSTLVNLALPLAATVFASLWEGVLVVSAVCFALRCLPRLGAASRYAIWLCALAAIVVIPVLTVRSSAPPAPAVTAAATVEMPVDQTASIAPRIDAAAAARGPAAVPTEPIPARGASASVPSARSRIAVPPSVALAVALLWLLTALARCVMLSVDLRDLAEVRRGARPWSTAYEYPVFLSDRVRVPLAIGFAQPAIVLPASVVDDLPLDDVEAIVVHEIAHLRRGDVWTNACARIAQALTACNPAAWFVMRRLSIEREIACDDWVVARTGAGDAFARTLLAMASRPGNRVPIAAPSAFGSRHSIVQRIENLLDARPRQLRLSAVGVAGVLGLLAAVALAAQSVSPVLAYERPRTDAAAQPPIVADVAPACAVPNRPVRVAYLMGPSRYGPHTPPMDRELPDARAAAKQYGASQVATFDLTVDAAGRPRNVVVLSSPAYPGMVRHLTRVLMSSTYEPAMRNCVAVATTFRAAAPIHPPEPNTGSVITPVYPAGWSAGHPTACKVPTVSHARYRPGFAAGTSYSAMLPAFPDALKNMDVDSKYRTTVRVRVNAGGAATSVTVVDSSGSSAADAAVVTAARRARFPLTASNCMPRPAEYVWDTTFAKQSFP